MSVVLKRAMVMEQLMAVVNSLMNDQFV